MKKINSTKKVLSIALFAAIATLFSQTSVNAVNMNDAFPILYDTGINQTHSDDILKSRYTEYEQDNDLRNYEEEKSPTYGQDAVSGMPAGSVYKDGNADSLNINGVYVNNIEVAPSEILTKDEINNITGKLIGRNVSIDDIQSVIDQINLLYASKGFVTARAYLPEQTVQNGNIYIGLMESKIGNITVQQNRWTKDGYITRRIPEKAGQVLDIVELEKDVLDFNRYNEGIDLTANLRAGEQPGTTDIDLIADEKFPFHVMGIMDNAGRYNTGSLRGGAMIYADSLFGHRDRLSIGSYFSGGAQSPFADYNFPINKKDGRLGFMFSSTFANVKWGPYTDLDLKSRAYQYSLYYSQPLIRKSGFELKSYAAINYKRSTTIVGALDNEWGRRNGYEDIIDNVTSAEVALQARKDTKYGIWYLNQDAYYSFPIFDSYNDNNYFKYSGSIVRLHDFSHGVIGQLRSNYQIVPGDKSIPYMDQMQTGGLVTVRGYSEGLMIGKNGYFISGELMFPLMPREITSPRTGEKIPFIGKYVKGAVFADTAGIFPAPRDDHYGGRYFAASLGMGLRIQLPLDLTARLYWGFPLIRNHYEPYSKMGRFHFELTMSPNIDALLASRSTKPQPRPVPQTTFQKQVEAEYINNYDDIRHYDYFRDGGGGSL